MSPTTTVAPPPALAEHLARLHTALDLASAHLALINRWGERLHSSLRRGGRLLVAGNGGSAAQAQHLAAELVGRYEGERRPYSAIALTADTAILTALANDYGVEEIFARQVAAHGRPGDVILGLSTSGRSPNVVRAATAARELGMETWALTGPDPSPLGQASTEVLAVRCDRTSTIQEVHQTVIHLLCTAFDARAGTDRHG